MKVGRIFSQYGILAILFVLIAVFSIGSDRFLAFSNFINIFRQITVLTIITIGMSFVLIAGGIDLSVGAQLSFIGVITATLFTKGGINPMLACVIGVAIATGVGVLNGLFIANTRVPPLIATLAMQQILTGMGYIISRGRPIYGLDESVKFLGQGYIGAVPFPSIVMVICIPVR